ncbi:MAG: histidine triad (HIT) family protein [Flavobacteriaceae bacterium]|jgi:histidine triad (HIT) family protein
MSEKNVFEKIIDGDVSCTKVFEDNTFVAFMDIFPVSFGHILIIPKEKGYVWVQDMPDDLAGDIFILAKKLIPSIKKALNCDYVQISISGTDIPHVHIHLIPRYFDDNLKGFPNLAYENNTHMNNIADSIRNEITE